VAEGPRKLLSLIGIEELSAFKRRADEVGNTAENFAYGALR